MNIQKKQEELTKKIAVSHFDYSESYFNVNPDSVEVVIDPASEEISVTASGKMQEEMKDFDAWLENFGDLEREAFELRDNEENFESGESDFLNWSEKNYENATDEEFDKAKVDFERFAERVVYEDDQFEDFGLSVSLRWA